MKRGSRKNGKMVEIIWSYKAYEAYRSIFTTQ